MFKSGERVRLLTHDKQPLGEVKYFGDTDFAAGKWYGIELDEPLGKHDGKPNAIRYFTATPNHGIFIHKSCPMQLVDKDGKPLLRKQKRLKIRRKNANNENKDGTGAIIEDASKAVAVAVAPPFVRPAGGGALIDRAIENAMTGCEPTVMDKAIVMAVEEECREEGLADIQNYYENEYYGDEFYDGNDTPPQQKGVFGGLFQCF